MKKSVNRPERLEVAKLDVAVQEALLRVAKTQELSLEECQSVSGGGPRTIGYLPTEE